MKASSTDTLEWIGQALTFAASRLTLTPDRRPVDETGSLTVRPIPDQPRAMTLLPRSAAAHTRVAPGKAIVGGSWRRDA